MTTLLHLLLTALRSRCFPLIAIMTLASSTSVAWIVVSTNPPARPAIRESAVRSQLSVIGTCSAAPRVVVAEKVCAP